MSMGGVEPHPSLDDAIVYAFAEGESVPDIAHRHNLSTDAVYDIVRRTVGSGAGHSAVAGTHCLTCGAGMPAQAVFCSRCGHRAPDPAVPPPPGAGFGLPPGSAYGAPPSYPPMGPPTYPPASPYPGVGASPGDPVHWLVPTGRSWQAILAGYLGLFSLVLWFVGPIAAGFGIWALARSAQDHRLHGRGRAIFGIVAGAAGTAALMVVLAARG